MSNEFLKKYIPCKTSELIGNKTQVTNIKEWLKNYDENKLMYLSKKKKGKNRKFISNDIKKMKSCILLTGNHGIGKTIAIDVILKELDYVKIPIDVFKIKSKDEIIYFLENTEKRIKFNFMLTKKKQKHVIVIDNIESIVSPIGTKSITYLTKYNNNRWVIPIIFIASRKHKKVTTLIKKEALEYKFVDPPIHELFKLTNKICDKEHIIINNICKEKLIIHSNSDIRKLIMILNDIKNTLKSNVKIDEEYINNYIENTKSKIKDSDLFQKARSLCSNYKSIENCLNIYYSDKVSLPLMMQKNYYKNVKQGSNKLKICAEIASYLAKGDVIEDYIYSNQNWDLYDIHGFYTCVIPSYLVSHNKNYFVSTELPDDFNRTSITSINKKNISNATTNKETYDIFDLININTLLTEFIVDDKLDLCADVIKTLKLTYDQFESILKLNKINYKKIINNKIKKKIQFFLNN